MKTLSACLYCVKKKECLKSAEAHSFMEMCFVPEDKTLREAMTNLQLAVRLALPADIWDKSDKVAAVLIKQSENARKLAQKVITYGCAGVCAHGGSCPYECEDNTECLNCEDPCSCQGCFDGEKIKIDWSKLNET